MKLIPKQDSPSMAKQNSPDLEQQIRTRAYELYEGRGRADGHDMDDWLRAESEITGGKQELLAA